MNFPVSKHLNERQLKGLEKVGQTLVPSEGDLPGFSESGCLRAIDGILDYMPASDLSDLKTLLTILGWFPGFIVGMLMRFIEWAPAMPGPIAPVLRMVRIGLRGLIVTLYYGHPAVHSVLGYKVQVYTGDLRPGGPRPTSSVSREATI